MGIFSRLFKPRTPAPVPTDSEILLLGLKHDFRRLSKLMKHENAEVRKMVVEAVATAGKTRNAGGGELHFSEDFTMDGQALQFLISVISDPDPQVRELIVQKLEESKVPEVEDLVKKYRSQKESNAAEKGGGRTNLRK